MVERTHMPERNAPGLIDQDLCCSLYDLLAREYGIEPATGTETVVAVNADRHLASVLEVPLASALLATVRVTTTADGRPFEYTLRHARGDLLAFTVALDSGADAGGSLVGRPPPPGDAVAADDPQRRRPPRRHPSRTPTVEELALEGVSKHYGAVVAVADATVAFRRGEIAGLVGENGAGKSTLISLVTGAQSP